MPCSKQKASIALALLGYRCCLIRHTGPVLAAILLRAGWDIRSAPRNGEVRSGRLVAGHRVGRGGRQAGSSCASNDNRKGENANGQFHGLILFAFELSEMDDSVTGLSVPLGAGGNVGTAARNGEVRSGRLMVDASARSGSEACRCGSRHHNRKCKDADDEFHVQLLPCRFRVDKLPRS